MNLNRTQGQYSDVALYDKDEKIGYIYTAAIADEIIKKINNYNRLEKLVSLQQEETRLLNREKQKKEIRSIKTYRQRIEELEASNRELKQVIEKMYELSVYSTDIKEIEREYLKYYNAEESEESEDK